MSRSIKGGYSGSKRWDKGCRNHGRCSYCSDGRQHCSRRREPLPFTLEDEIHPAEYRLIEHDAREAQDD